MNKTDKDSDNFPYNNKPTNGEGGAGSSAHTVWSRNGREQLISLLAHIYGTYLKLMSLSKLMYADQSALSYVAVYCFQNGKMKSAV